MKRLSTIFISLIGFLISLPISAQRVEVSPKLSRDTILIGDQIEWSAGFTLNEGVELSYAKPQNPLMEGVEIVEEFSLDTLKVRKGLLSLEAKMILTSFDSGSYRLPSLVFELIGKDGVRDSLVVVARDLEVTTIEIDTTSFVPFDIKGQIEYKVTFKEMLPWFVTLLILLFLSYLIYRMIQNKRNNKDLFGRDKVVDPPHIIALRELEKIRNAKMWQSGKEKEFYTAVTDVLREYIEARFLVSTMEKTSGEIISELERMEIERAVFDDLQQLFAVSDLVKFAKYIASGSENENAIPIAVRFVNSTFLQKIDEEK